jgi:hypothetical protein
MRPSRHPAVTAACALLAAAVHCAHAQKVNYEEHVAPILRNSCFRCHDADTSKADLNLSSYAAALKGGGNGKIVVSGDPDGSKLYKAVTHAEEPTMPPKSKLPDKEIEIIKQWILGGLLEKSGSQAVALAKPKVDLGAVAPVVGKPDGPPPMPQDVLLEPVVHAARASACIALAGSPWAPLVALGGPHQVLLYNTDTLELAGVLPFPEGFPCDIKFSRNGKLLVAGGGRGSKKGLVAVWEVASGNRMLAVGDETDAVLAADISADQKWIALGGPNRLVKIFATATGEMVHKIKKHTEWVTAAEFSPDSKLLATGDRNGGLVVWETAAGEELYTLNGHKAAITSVAWRGPGILASASEDGSVRLWSMEEGQQVKTWNAHNGGTLAMRCAHDGRVVTCGRDNQVAVWGPDGGKQKSFAVTTDIPVRVTFSHDGGRVIVCDWQGNAGVWATSDAKKIGDVALNPPPLAEQQQRAEKRVQELEELAAKSPGDKSKADLAAAKAAVERLKAAQFFTTVHHAREDYAKHKAEREQLLAEAAAAEAAAKKAAEDLAAARKLKPRTTPDRSDLARRIKSLGDDLKANSSKAASARKAADKLDKMLAEEKARVEKLTADYQRLKGQPAPAAPLRSAMR